MAESTKVTKEPSLPSSQTSSTRTIDSDILHTLASISRCQSMNSDALAELVSELAGSNRATVDLKQIVSDKDICTLVEGQKANVRALTQAVIQLSEAVKAFR